MLALVFAPTLTEPLPAAIEPLVSAWGADPLWEPSETPPYDRLKTHVARLPERPLLSDVQNAEVRVESLIAVLPVPLPAVGAPDPRAPKELEVPLDIAAFRPRLDEQKNLWYVDVDIQAPTYFTFLRLGLARYQPYAEEGRSLSGLVGADFCQLVSDVEVCVVPGPKGCHEVTVTCKARETEIERDRSFSGYVVAAKHSVGGELLELEGHGREIFSLTYVESVGGRERWVGVTPLQGRDSKRSMLITESQVFDDSARCQRVVGCVHLTF
jgi:hypothetical protein